MALGVYDQMFSCLFCEYFRGMCFSVLFDDDLQVGDGIW